MTASLQEVVEVIAAGGVAAVPTDTVYGLVCDPSSAAAVDRVYAIKRRPADLELTLLVAGLGQADRAVVLDERARRLAARYWPGPLSIVAPLREGRYAIPRHGATLSVRLPSHPLLLTLLRRTGPLASTSANRHGDPPAATAGDALAALGDEIDAIIDGGIAGGQASTIIDCSRTPPRVLREGPIPGSELLALAAMPTSPERTRIELE